MKVLARMNRIAWDRQRERYVVNWRLPKDLHAVLSSEVCDRISRDGKWFRDRFPKGMTPTKAAKLEAERLVEFNNIVAGAREMLATPERRAEIVARLADKAAVMMLAQGDRLVALQAGMRKLHDDHESVRRLASLGVAMTPAAPAVKVVKPQDVIDAWIAARTRDKNPPEDQAVQNKRSKLARLFAFLAGVHLPARLKKDQIDEWLARSNMAAVSESDLRRYRLHLLKLGGRREYDALVDLSSLFGIAREYLDLKNPMTEWSLPAHISGTRGTTTEPETGALLLAARDGIANGETWLWPIVLAAFLGTGNDETLGSAAADFFPIPSGPFAGTWVWEMRHRLLKDSRQGEGSGYRNRLVPLHSKLREWGFPEYVASRKGCAAGKLFGDESVDVASNNLNAWITETLKAAGFQAHRTFYCLRHRAHRKVPDNAVGRYVTGHAARDVHERYIKIDPVDLPEDYHRVIEAVEAVPDPTAEQSN